MGVTTDIKSDGSMILHRFDKNQQVYLPRDSVMSLISFKDEVNSSIESKIDNKWLLGDEKNRLFAQVTKYQGDILIHFRVWWGEQPTKQGITMGVSEWYHFIQFLQFDDESTLALSVLENMLSSALSDAIKSECEGCAQNYLSQNDHPCIMDPLSTANRHVNRLFDNLNIYQFTIQLAQKAAEINLIIKRPFDTFTFLRGIKEEEIKRNALAQFRY